MEALATQSAAPNPLYYIKADPVPRGPYVVEFSLSDAPDQWRKVKTFDNPSESIECLDRQFARLFEEFNHIPFELRVWSKGSRKPYPGTSIFYQPGLSPEEVH